MGTFPWCCTHVGFTSQSPVEKIRSDVLVPRVIFRTNAPGSSGPRAPGGKRSAVFTGKVVLTELRRGMFGPSDRETCFGRAESNGVMRVMPLRSASGRRVAYVAASAAGEAIDGATREATHRATWRATDRATVRAMRTATQTVMVRATGRATGRAMGGVTGTTILPATGTATGEAIRKAIGTAIHQTTYRATGTAICPATPPVGL